MISGRIRIWLWSVLVMVLTVACTSESPGPVIDTAGSDVSYAALEPAAPRLLRLTQQQYRNCIADLFGPEIVVPASLELDTAIDGLLAVGASVTAVSPRGAELYEEAALKIAEQVMQNETSRAGLMACTPEDVDDEDCMTTICQGLAFRIWRRPPDDEETASLVQIGLQASVALDDFHAGVHYVLVAMLQSPNFLYRTELGEPDLTEPGQRRLTDFEMASRLAFFLWNTTPDFELLNAALTGELASPEGVAAQVDRMMQGPQVRTAVRNFVTDWLLLFELDHLNKDPNIFKHYSPDLGDMAREETLALVEYLVFETDRDFREFFTSNTTFATRRLAAIYNFPATVDEGLGRIDFPADSPRRGFLGHVSFLGLHAHPVSSSATERGKFVRENLFCEMVPPPPADLNTGIPEPSASAKTLKERLIVHMEEPSCAGCHAYLDIIGFGFENFDGIGRFRTIENGAQIDPSGDVDGEDFADSQELTELIANDPRTMTCLTRKLYSYALGHGVVSGEEGSVQELADTFGTSGHRLLALMAAVARSEAFRRVGEVE